MTTTPTPYPIGTPGLPWGEAEVATWLSRQTVKRSYEADVLRVIEPLSSRYDVVQYGRLDYHPDKYPLFAIKSRGWREVLPSVLVTGGVHGYETSGVHGALRFVDEYAATYEGRVNLMVAPCVSPRDPGNVRRESERDECAASVAIAKCERRVIGPMHTARVRMNDAFRQRGCSGAINQVAFMIRCDRHIRRVIGLPSSEGVEILLAFPWRITADEMACR
jgi:hypothetical protein